MLSQLHLGSGLVVMFACVPTLFFFFNATAPTEIYTLSLHDALPICFDAVQHDGVRRQVPDEALVEMAVHQADLDRKSTRLNSSHGSISYAVFCLKKKKTRNKT